MACVVVPRLCYMTVVIILRILHYGSFYTNSEKERGSRRQSILHGPCLYHCFLPHAGFYTKTQKLCAKPSVRVEHRMNF